ncbi:MAG TPA: M50 family metallopeptidase [Bacteroidales bacterium]|nr:M50 family metallopeptidase [Bacteroidales bacterium]
MYEEYKNYVLYALPLVVLITNRIPYVGKFLRIINTLIHESGHALMALISNGEVYEVELFGDRSGAAIVKTKGKFSMLLVALSGYVIGSAFACLMFFLISIGKYDLVIYSVAIVALLNLTFLVRNTYGIFWIITFIVVLLLARFYLNDFFQFVFTAWISAVMLFEAFYSSFELVIMASRKPKTAGDAAALAKITGIPAMVWALFFVLQSGFFVYLSIRLFF